MIPMKSYTPPTLGIVVLAAGFSVRLGQPKALATVRGKNLLTRTLRILAPFSTTKILVIVPPAAARYRIGISARSVIFAPNRQRASGLASSVRLGIRRSRYCSAVLLLPVDLVHLRKADIGRLIARWRSARRHVAARHIGSSAGAPLVLPRWLYPKTANRTGDTGLRDLIRSLPASALSLVHMPSAEFDIDTPDDLDRARHRHGSNRLAASRAD
jgi:molybdenum cofactor cytidylyltransferase